MTKKDYELIAKVIFEQLTELNRSKQVGEDVRNDQLANQVHGLRITAYELADAFGYENGRFKPATFLKACGFGA